MRLFDGFDQNINIENAPKLSIRFKQIMNEQYHFSKLADIKKQLPNEKVEFTTMGVIVDCTTPHRKDVKREFCVKLKMIDPTAINEPCHVFLYSKNVEDFPKNIKVGDILFLNKYGFEFWKDNLQAKKHFKIFGAEFRFFSGDPAAENYAPIAPQSGIDDFDGSIINLLRELRRFSSAFFKKNNVPLYTKSSNKASDFDLLLQVKSCQKLNQGFKIHMTNSVNQFQINYKYEVEPGNYKVRSIADLSWNGKKCLLTGNDYTCFLRIPNWMKSHDPKEWEKLASAKTPAALPAQKAIIETKILHEKRGERRREVALKELVMKDEHTDEVTVTCEFIECFTSFSDALRRYDAPNHTEKRYDNGDGEYIYSVHYVITDKSLEGELYNVYLYTYDQRGLEFLPGLHPDKIFGRNILNYQQKYDHINDRLLEETDLSTCALRIALSPMCNGRDVIYRIVDTELLI